MDRLSDIIIDRDALAQAILVVIVSGIWVSLIGAICLDHLSKTRKNHAHHR